MIVVRNTFQGGFGRMKEALAHMKESMALVGPGNGNDRPLTDLAGDVCTLVPCCITPLPHPPQASRCRRCNFVALGG
jgi:hypothetical protein